MLKNRKIYRALAMILTVTILISTFASCGETEGSFESAEETSGLQSVTEHESETERRDSLPADLRYDDEEIIFISCDDITFDDITGDVVADSIYERNLIVTERLGTEITCINDNDPVGKVAIAVGSGSNEYDILVDVCWNTAPKFIENYFRDLRMTEFLDFDKPWWDQSFNAEMSYNDAQFGITGAMMLSLYRRTYITVFNKELFTNANQPFLYEYVENGTWTLDKQISLVPLFHQDNGNNQQDMTGDVYGFLSNDFIYVDPYWTSCEIDIIKKNADGEYEWAFDASKIYDVAEKVLTLFYKTDDGSYIEADDYLSERTVWDMFSAGSGAMATVCLVALEDAAIRNMPQEYGVVPIPKYSESQTQYYSQMHNGFTIACIPNTVSEERANMLSAVLEIMSSTSYTIVRPVYYETVLRTRLAKDPQSAAMLDMIISNIRIDVGFLYALNIGTFNQEFQKLVAGKQNDSASRFKRSAASSQRALSVLIARLNKISDR